MAKPTIPRLGERVAGREVLKSEIRESLRRPTSWAADASPAAYSLPRWTIAESSVIQRATPRACRCSHSSLPHACRARPRAQSARGSAPVRCRRGCGRNARAPAWPARHDADVPGVDQFLRRPHAFEGAENPGDRPVRLEIRQPVGAALAQVDYPPRGRRPGRAPTTPRAVPDRSRRRRPPRAARGSRGSRMRARSAASSFLRASRRSPPADRTCRSRSRDSRIQSSAMAIGARLEHARLDVSARARRISPASSSTKRCLEIAFTDMPCGLASSVTRAGPGQALQQRAPCAIGERVENAVQPVVLGKSSHVLLNHMVDDAVHRRYTNRQPMVERQRLDATRQTGGSWHDHSSGGDDRRRVPPPSTGC